MATLSPKPMVVFERWQRSLDGRLLAAKLIKSYGRKHDAEQAVLANAMVRVIQEQQLHVALWFLAEQVRRGSTAERKQANGRR